MAQAGAKASLKVAFVISEKPPQPTLRAAFLLDVCSRYLGLSLALSPVRIRIGRVRTFVTLKVNEFPASLPDLVANVWAC